VVEYAELNVKTLSSEGMIRAIWRSFAKGEGYKVPPKSQCFLSRSSLNFLIDKLGLVIGKGDFGLEAARVENLPQIVKGAYRIETRSHCFFLLRLVLEKLGEGASETIQKVVDAGVVPTLVRFLRTGTIYERDVSSILYNISLKGSDSTVKVLVDAGALPQLVSALQISNGSEISSRESVLTLGHMASRSTDIRDAVLKEDALTALLNQPIRRYLCEKANGAALQTLESLLFGESPPNLDEYKVDTKTLSRIFEVYCYSGEALLFACTALSYVCHSPSKHRERIGDSNLFSPLLDMMSC